jgi:hypothetical protein
MNACLHVLQDALSRLLDGVYEFCACVSPAGVAPFARLDGQVAASLLAALPLGPTLGPRGANVGSLSPNEAKQVCCVVNRLVII